MSGLAFVAIVSKRDEPGPYSIGAAERYIRGYTPCPHHGTYGTWDQAVEKSRELNEDLGLSFLESLKIIGSSMRD